MTITPFREAHWSRDPFTYRGFAAYWDDDHPEQVFWMKPELAEAKYPKLVENETLRKWDSIDEMNLNLSQLTPEEQSVLEWKRAHYFIDLELLCFEPSPGELEVVSHEEVLEWAGIDPGDVIGLQCS